MLDGRGDGDAELQRVFVSKDFSTSQTVGGEHFCAPVYSFQQYRMTSLASVLASLVDQVVKNLPVI